MFPLITMRQGRAYCLPTPVPPSLVPLNILNQVARLNRAVVCTAPSKMGVIVANKMKRVAWTKALHAELRKHSRARTPVAKISKQMKRTVGALRQQALKLGIGLGHQR